MSGLYAIAGHGILRDLPINPQLIGDQIPVDFVCNQLLAAQVFQVEQFKETDGKQNLLITHSSSSASNGVTWGEVIKVMDNQFAHDSYDNAVMAPKLTAHTNSQSYKLAYTVKSVVPAKALFYLSKVIGTKKMKKDA
jgi:hypothetical protein